MGVTLSHIPNSVGEDQPAVWMVLEDDYSLRSLLEEMIKLWGRRPLIFPDGFRASTWLDEAEAGKVTLLPEVALLDIRVPGPQGPEIAQRMRSLPITANIPIVIMTAYRVDSDEKKEIMAVAQPDAFISKGDPIFDMLKDLLEKVIRESKGRKPASQPEVQPEVQPEPAPASLANSPAQEAKPEPAPASSIAAPAQDSQPESAPASAAKPEPAPASVTTAKAQKPEPDTQPEVRPEPPPAATGVSETDIHKS